MSRKRPSEPFWGWRHGIPYPLPWKRSGGPFLRLCGGAERCCPRLFQNSGGTRQKMSPGKRPRGRRAKLIAGWADLRHQGPGKRALDLMPGIGKAPPGSKPTRARGMLHHPEPRAAARTPRRRSGGPRGAGDGDPGALGGPRSQETGAGKRERQTGAGHAHGTPPPRPAPPEGATTQPTRTATTKKGRRTKEGGTRRTVRGVRTRAHKGRRVPGGWAPTAGGRRTQTPAGGGGSAKRGRETDRRPGGSHGSGGATASSRRPPSPQSFICAQ